MRGEGECSIARGQLLRGLQHIEAYSQCLAFVGVWMFEYLGGYTLLYLVEIEAA